MLVAAYLLLFLLTLALIVSVAQLAALVPQYTDQIKDAVANAATRCRTSASSRSRSTPS